VHIVKDLIGTGNVDIHKKTQQGFYPFDLTWDHEISELLRGRMDPDLLMDEDRLSYSREIITRKHCKRAIKLLKSRENCDINPFSKEILEKGGNIDS